jgi:periplasmic divalent cation tolerance protein
MDQALQVVTTAASREDVQRIAAALVERRLAACAQIAGPVESVYRWEGRIETSTEWRLIVKTRRELYAAVEGAIRELHPYDTPQIIALPIVAGSRDYLDWIEAECPAPDSGGAPGDGTRPCTPST